MYADNVLEDTPLKNPRVLLGITAVVGLLIYMLDPVPLIASIMGPDAQTSQIHHILFSGAAAIVFSANLLLISLLPRLAQRIVVYCELLAMVLLFALLFDLNFVFVFEKLPYMLYQGVTTTLYVSAISIAIASVIALVTALAKLSSNEFARTVASFYTSLFRGLPLLMQLYLIYLGLPQLGFVIDPIPAGVAALSLCYGAYMAEVFRSGIMSISWGQWEASRALGFKFGTTMRRIILPQSFPVIIPPTGNMFIAMLKDSSLVSVIGIWDLMFLARNLGSQTFQHMEMLLTAAMIYWIMTVILEMGQSRLERHFQKSTRR